jgi:tetratricopeptide (TPR) repeat protein
MQVLSGTFEGDVFLGTVFICQVGPSCETEKAFPFFAVYHGGALAGDVKLDVGCSSPGLEGRRLNVAVASPEDRLLISQDSENSASSIAGKNSNRKELEARAREAFNAGQLKIKENNFSAARTALERSISYDDGDWKTWMLLGQVELKLGNAAKGLECLQKAILAARPPKARLTDQELGDLFYNHACAQARNGKKKDAITSLRSAFRVGDLAELIANAQEDPDLDALREEPDFKKVLADAKAKKDKRGPKP